jgi:uncharacterized membrane protein
MPRAAWAGIGTIVVVGLALRVAWTLHEPWNIDGLLIDAQAYHFIANSLAGGHGFASPTNLLSYGVTSPSAREPPLFPFALAAVSKVGWTSIKAHRLAGCVFGAAAIAFAGLLGRRIGGTRCALIAAGLMAIYPTRVEYDGGLLSEALYVPLIGLTLLLALRALERPVPWRFVALGVAIGLATETRDEGLILALVLALPLALVAGGQRRWRNWFVTLAATAVVIAPWAIRSTVELHHPILVADKVGPVLAGANCHEGYYGPNIGFGDIRCLLGIAHPPRNEAAQSDALRNRALRYARHHLIRLPVVAGVRVLRLWDFWQPFRRPQLGARLVYFAVLALAIAGAIRLRRRRELTVLLAPLVSVTIASVLAFGDPRYRAAAEPALIVLAAVTLSQIRAPRARGLPSAARATLGSRSSR